MTGTPSVRSDARAHARGVDLAATSFLLVTYGAAIAAAVVPGLTAAEVTWAALYLTAGEGRWIAPGPVLAGALLATWLLRWSR